MFLRHTANVSSNLPWRRALSTQFSQNSEMESEKMSSKLKIVKHTRIQTLGEGVAEAQSEETSRSFRLPRPYCSALDVDYK